MVHPISNRGRASKAPQATDQEKEHSSDAEVDETGLPKMGMLSSPTGVVMTAGEFKMTHRTKDWKGEMNMKVFISQPMKGKTDEQILKEREEALTRIRLMYKDADPIDTYIPEEIPEKHGGLRYLAKSIDMLDEADSIWMLNGWQDARGCRLEHDAAVAYGIPVYYLY